MYGVARGEPLVVTLAVTEVGSYLDLDGEGAEGYEDLGNGKLRVTLPVGQLIESVSIPLLENAAREADGSVTITIEPDPGGSYTPSVGQSTLTIPVKDNDTPSTVSISAPDSITEGGPLSYTLTRTWAPGQSQGELSVNVQLEQTGDYITWPTAHQPDADGLVTIPVNFAARSLTATLTLETVDDQMSEDNGSVTATILADADGSYVTGADSGHTTRLLDNDPPIISVAAVSAEVTEGTDAQFRFSRMGNTSGATRVGLWVGGLPKIMTDATEAIALTADNADLSQRLHIHGAWVDYILEFAAGEAEKTLSFTTEADNVNEGDGRLGVTIVQRAGNPFGIGTGDAQVHIHDDDVPTVTFSQVTLPTGAATLEGDTWVGELGEVQPLSWVVSCSGNYEYSPLPYNPSVSGLPVQLENIRLANHPAFYGGGTGWKLGRNILGYVWGGICDGQAQTSADKFRVVGPDGGVETFKLVPKDRAPSIVAEYGERYRQAKAAADAAGTLVTQPDIIHPVSVRLPHTLLINCSDEPRYCPQYRVGTPHKIRLTLVNRDPTILIKAENSEVEEGQPARFVVERLWSKDLLTDTAPHSTTFVSLRAAQNGQYITGALPTEITFERNETSKIIELATVDDSAFGANGSVTIELLSDTTGADLNIAGKYETFEHWAGHTPEGARSDRATIAITNNDDKPGITIAPASALEGDSGSADMTFTVTLAQAVTEAVTVNYATSDGTATAGQDYTAVSNGSVTIAADNTTAEFTVSVTGDEADELDETFNVTISMPEPEPNLNGGSSGEPAAAITGGDTATVAGTILDDDPAVVTVAPKVDTVEEGEEAVFLLTRAGVLGGALAMQVRLRAPGRLETLDARFEPGAATAEIAIATHDNNLVDYPSVRDYTIEVFGDGEPLDRDDRIFTPGDPATATVKVTDDEELINVTVYPVEAVASWTNGADFRFRRDGDITDPLKFGIYYFVHRPGERETWSFRFGTFEAGKDEVVVGHGGFHYPELSPEDAVGLYPLTVTYAVFGDGGRYGLNRVYQGGDPSSAIVAVQYDDWDRALVVGSDAPLWVTVGQTVRIPLTVTNTGSLDSLTSIDITSQHYSDGTNEPRLACQIDGPIADGESKSCEASFLVQENDLNSNNAIIRLDVTASDGQTTSKASRVYMRVRNGVSIGFTESANLSVNEPVFGEDNAEATLTVTRVGQSGEEVQVAYTLEPSASKNRPYPPVEGVDYADNSDSPGVITFAKNETEKTITIDIIGDQIDEEREQFRVTLVPPEGVLVEEDKKYRTVVINDATPPPGESYRPKASLQLVSADPTPESAGSVDFAVVLDRVWGKDARFEVELDAHDNLTATPAFSRHGQAGDFEAPDGLIHATIPAGQTRFEFSLTLYDDDVREDDETFQMLLTSPYDDSHRTIGTSNRALATIADDDRIPPTEVVLSLSHNGSALESVPEGSTQQDITVTVSFPRKRWPGDASNAPLRPADPLDVDTTVRVQFDPNSGATHAAGLDDFAPLEVEDDQGAFQEVESFDISIPAGQTSGSATLRFRPVNDAVDEEDETVTLLGSELVAGDSADSLPVRSASFTIIDDDTTGITISPAKLAAGTGISMKEGGTSTYSLVLDSEPTDTVTVTVAGRQGDLISLTPETLTFTPSDWSTAKTISVVSLDDGTDTSFTNAVISHQVSGGDYGSVTVREIWVQIENTTQAYIYLDDAQASESDGHLEFTVSVRPILRTVPVVVRYATVDGTAVAGTDYTREVTTDQTYNVFSIPANRDTGIIRIPITDNQVYGPAKKTFTLQLTNQNNKANLEGDATSLTATGSILDDDPKPVVSVAGPAGAVSYVSENAKDPVTFTLTLVGQSAGDVTVDYATGEAGLIGLLTARQGLAGATEDEDYAGTSGTVTFTPGQTTKTVTVQVTDDDVSEDTEFFGFKISAPQGADLRGQRSEDVADVGLVDDDARGVAIDPTSIGLREPASGETAVAGAYTVKLSSSPTDTVTVTIGGGDPAVSLSGDTLTNNQLTFTTTNWNTAQTITVTPVKDDNAVGETITLTHTLSGGDYAGIAADSVTVNLTDSDTRNLVLSKESLTVAEGDATGVRYTVELATQPSDTVTVTISGHDGADLTLSGTTLTNNQLTFTTTNWGTAQTVTVKAGDDDNADNESETLAHTASGGDYVNITKDLPVSITDDDTAAIVLSETGLTVIEGDAAGSSYTVKLATEPTGSVTVSITGHDGTDLSLSGTTLSSNMLTFAVDNWNTAQTVTVKAGEDNDGANDTGTLTHTASGGDYVNVTKDLPVRVTDDDTAAIVLSETDLTVTEGDAAGVLYTVRLATQPSGSVTVTISGHDGTDLSLSGTTLSSNMLTFTADNWDDAQTVTVTAAEDDDAVTDAGVTLTHTVSGGGYGSTTVPDVEVSITENDSAGIVISKDSLTVGEGDAAGSRYTVKLATQPTGEVIVTVSGHAGTDLSLSGTTLSSNMLTFTVDNWDTAQTVTVKAGEDDDGSADTATLTHTASGGDYASITAALPVTVTDDDEAGVTIEPTALSVVAGQSNEYTVRLATEPTGEVTVTVSGHAGTAVTLDKTTLTFTTTNWNTAQTVTVKAGEDDDGANDTATLTHTASGGDYASITAALPVTVTDDDEPAVVLSETGLTVTEGDAAGSTYTVKLATQPSGSVTVSISGHDGADLTLSGTTLTNNQLTFTTTNWNTAQTVTVKAGEDADGSANTATLTHTASGGDYASISAGLPVTVTDDDEAGVTIEPTALSVVADRSNEYTVRLATEPTGEVTVTVSGHAGTAVTLDKTTLTFAMDNWDTAQTVTVSATQNAATAKVTLAHAVAGADYGSVTAEPVVVSVVGVAGQQPTLQIGVSSSAQTLTVPEGEANSYTLVLGSRPTGDVTVGVTLPAGTDLTLDKTSLTFTMDNWDVAQTVVVTAAEDDDAVTDAGVTLTHTVSGGGYGSTTVPDVEVSITENDSATIVLSETGLTVTEGDAAGSSYTVKLATEPTGEVTVTVSGHAGTDLTLSGTTLTNNMLTFTVDNWETAQTVTVKAGQDADGSADTATLTHTASGGDYASVSNTLPVTVTDDDQAVTVQFGADAYTVSEGSTTTITVTLSADPQSTVVIPLVATDQGGAVPADYSVPSSVMFNTGEMSKTFEFMAMADDASDTGESVMIGFGTSLPSRVTEGTPNEARVTINQMSTQFSLDCSLTATVWCADLGFSDRVAENYGWLYMRYGHGWDPPSSLSDDDFRFRGVDYDVRNMELRPGTHPVMPSAWSRWQQGYSSFRIGIYWDYRWGAPSEEHYRDWVLHLDGLELPFKDALRHGGDFVWVGEEFQQVFNDWTPSTVTKIGIKEVAAADQDTNPLLPWAPMQVDAWPEGPDRLLIVWAKPAWFYPGLPDPTSYIVQWKLASADWSDSAAVSQLEVAATSNFQAVIVNGMTEDAVYSVRVIASNDAGDGPPSEETLGRPQDSLPRLIARTVNGQTLTLRFSEQLDPNAVPAGTAFTVLADGGLIEVDSVAIRGNEVVLTLDRAVTAAAHSVKVRYDKPTDPSAVFLQDTNGNYANIRQHHELLEVVNITPQSSVQPLTAQFTNMPSSHDGRTRFTFDIEFSEPVWTGDGLARDDMLEITGGTVISAPWKDRRTDKFIVHVRPDTQGDIVIVLPGHRACHGIVGSYREVPDPVAGAPCAVGSRVLTNEPTVTIPGPSSPAQQVVENTPAEGEPQINGIPESGQTLSADTTAIADADGLENVVFQYQWLAEDADIPDATGATYTVVSGDVGKAITVRVTFTDDAGNEETLTSAPAVVTAAGLQLQSATVDGATLTLTYNEVLDTGVTLGTTPFAVNVNGSSRSLIGVGVGESNVLLLLSSAVEVGDTVTVDYTAPDGPDFIRDIRGRKAASFSGQAVTNAMASAPLTASAHDAPSSHNGQDAFTFEMRFSEDPEPDFSYTTVRDHAFTVTGGSVTYVRRLEPPSNIRWEITVTPGSSADVAIALNATTDCSAQGAICTEDGGMLSGGLLLAVPGPNTPATGAPTITGAAQVGETLTADTTGISDWRRPGQRCLHLPVAGRRR